MQIHKRTLSWKTLTENDVNTYKLPRNYYIQQIALLFELKYTTGSSAPTFVEDAPFTIIKRLRFKIAGAKNRTLVDVLPKSFISLCKLDNRLAPYSDTLGTNTSTAYTVNFMLKLDFRIDKANKYDTLAVIPAFQFSSVEVEMQVGDADDLASANAPTINYIKVKPTLTEIITDEAIESLEYYLISREHTLTESEIDLETGKVLRRLLLLTKDSSGNRSNSIINTYAIKVGKTPIISDTHFVTSRLVDREEYQVAPDTGVTMIDFADINDIENALDLTEAKEGDIKLEMDVADSNGKIELLYNWIA